MDSHARLERCQREFEKTANPLYVWEAWRHVRHTNRLHPSKPLEVPEWVAAYLDACALRLLGWDPVPFERPGEPRFVGPEQLEVVAEDWVYRPEPPDRVPKLGEEHGSIGRALEFPKGLAGCREDFRADQYGIVYDDGEMLAYRVVTLMIREDLSLDAACQKMEEAKYASRSSARRAVENARGDALLVMRSAAKRAGESVLLPMQPHALRRQFCGLYRKKQAK